MSKHAIERIFQRYGKELSWTDIRNIVKAIKEGNCYYVDAANDDRIIVLVLYEHLLLKLVYSATEDRKGAIVTALPLDIDEWNANLGQIPPVFRKRKKKKNTNN